MINKGRRRFLKKTAAIAAIASLELTTARWSEALAGAKAPKAGDYLELGKQISGRVILPTDADYAGARLVWNSQYDNEFPAAVVKAASPSDVSAAIRFARAFDLALIARGGSHSFAGYSTGPGLVLDLSGMNALSTLKGGEIANIGAGANLIGIYRELWKQRKAIPGGSCPTVGISGLTQGGGIGLFSREYGLTLDRLLGARIITADGKLLYLNERENSDLFWAIRGGGGGSFGVVTDFTIATVPVDMPINAGTYYFPWSKAEKVFMAYQDWISTLPKPFSATLFLRNETGGPGVTPTVYIEATYRGDRSTFNDVMADFIRTLGVAPTQADVETRAFYEWKFEEFCAGFSSEECAIQEKNAQGRIPRLGVSIFSNVMDKAWPTPAIDVIIDALERRQNDPVLQPHGVSAMSQAGKIFFEPVDGACASVASDATAFAHRGCLLNTQFQNRIPEAASESLREASNAWLSDMFKTLSPWRSGKSYVNYNNRSLEDWANAYYGSNLPRLQRIKSTHDPHNFFRFGQSIRGSA